MNRNPQQVYLASFLIWILFVAAHLVRYLLDVSVALPTDEVYANWLSFQLVAFGLTRFPFWLLGLIALLVAEICLLRRRRD